MSENALCFCWYEEVKCQFQRHPGLFTLCESEEIWSKCANNEDLNFGDSPLTLQYDGEKLGNVMDALYNHFENKRFGGCNET